MFVPALTPLVIKHTNNVSTPYTGGAAGEIGGGGGGFNTGQLT